LYIIGMTSRKTFRRIPAGVLQDGLCLLDEVQSKFEPYVVALPEAERQVVAEKGPEYFGFVELAYKFAVEYPELFPAFMETAAFNEEFSAVCEFISLGSKLNRLCHNIRNAEMAAAGTTLETALAFYQTVKIAARHDIPGARAIYEELKSKLPLRKNRRQKKPV